MKRFVILSVFVFLAFSLNAQDVWRTWQFPSPVIDYRPKSLFFIEEQMYREYMVRNKIREINANSYRDDSLVYSSIVVFDTINNCISDHVEDFGETYFVVYLFSDNNIISSSFLRLSSMNDTIEFDKTTYSYVDNKLAEVLTIDRENDTTYYEHFTYDRKGRISQYYLRTLNTKVTSDLLFIHYDTIIITQYIYKKRCVSLIENGTLMKKFFFDKEGRVVKCDFKWGDGAREMIVNYNDYDETRVAFSDSSKTNCSYYSFLRPDPSTLITIQKMDESYLIFNKCTFENNILIHISSYDAVNLGENLSTYFHYTYW